MGLGGVLGGTVVHRTTGSLEGHGAECTFVENLAVSLLDVAFQQGQSQVDDTTVDAPGQQRWGSVRPRGDTGRGMEGKKRATSGSFSLIPAHRLQPLHIHPKTVLDAICSK